MAYALRNFRRNLVAGLRLACFLRVDRLAFRIDLAQVLLLFALSAAIDVVGDYLRAAPPRQFAIDGLGSELYSGGVLLLAAALIALANRQRQLVLSIPLLVLAALPIVQIVHYVPSWFAFAGDWALPMLLFERVIVTWIVLVLVRCVAIAFSPPPSYLWLRAIVAGLVLATPIWLGTALFPNQPWWRGAGDEPEVSSDFNAGSEAVLAAQSYLLDNALDDLSDERHGETDLYFVGFAPYGRQDAFRSEVDAAQHVMDTRWGTNGHSITLVNNPKTLITAPFATITNLRETLNEIGSIIDDEQDVVMLYLTSSSARNDQLAAEQPPLGLVELGPAGLKQLLDDAGIKWRIIVVAACYSGGFVEPLADEFTLVITDTAPGQPGLTCDGRSPPTLFGDAFFQQGLAKGQSFETAFEIAKSRVAEREKAAGYSPASQPQWSMGEEMKEKLKSVRKRGATGSLVGAARPRFASLR
jgi:hypothetical protein